jgi:hypothetical protein
MVGFFFGAVSGQRENLPRPESWLPYVFTDIDQALEAVASSKTETNIGLQEVTGVNVRAKTNAAKRYALN